MKHVLVENEPLSSSACCRLWGDFPELHNSLFLHGFRPEGLEYSELRKDKPFLEKVG